MNRTETKKRLRVEIKSQIYLWVGIRPNASLSDSRDPKSSRTLCLPEEVPIMTKCIVKECKNTTQKNSGVTLHGFPNSLNAIKVWLIQTGNDFGDLDAFAQRVLESRSRWLYRMCSKHFSPQSYIWSGKKLVLKPDAVPTIFPGKVKNRYVTENLRSLPPSKRAQVEMQFQLHSIIKQHGGYHPTSLYVPPSLDPPHVSRDEPEVKPATKTTSTTTTTTTKVMVDKSTNTDPMFGKADKGVLWPEFEYNFDGEAWKIKHDHFYPYNHSNLRDSRKSTSDAETEQDFWYTNDYETDKNSRHYHCRYPVGVRPYIFMERNSLGDGKVPIKIEDLAVYFSKQEWEYIGQHWECYKDMLPEAEQPFSKFQQPKRSGTDHSRQDKVCSELKLNSLPYALDSPEERDAEEMLITEDGLYSSVSGDAPSLTGDIKEEAEEVAITDNCLSAAETAALAYLSDNIKEEIEEITVTDSHLNSSQDPHLDSSDEFHPSRSMFNKCLKPASLDEEVAGASCWPGEHKSNEYHRTTYKISTSTDSFNCPNKSVIIKKRVVASDTDSQSKDRPHRCRACNECFPDKNQLAVHRRKHIAKSLRCPTCGKAFRFQSQLIKHQKTHKEENVYTCPICGVQYEHKVQFAAHMRVHPGDKPYMCDECGSCFVQKGSLVLHQKKHKGLDVYRCKLCGNRFDKRSKLKNHLKFHRLEKTPIFS
ncbi:zinc finger protein 8 isoform X2 [Xenopus laevis]|uniref:Zinc finger protein 8 isoform X2 n=1 Tax=Xenopus laevis TaxID=8355 RepID=A0A8J0TLK7_XENLA|nr:zinc finger protein 8 isoform X2 [Xenopus laevis]